MTQNTWTPLTVHRTSPTIHNLYALDIVWLASARLGRFVLVVTLAAAVAVFYLGGWLGPVLPPWAWSALKTLLVAAVMLTAGRFLPRLREAHVLEWGWKIGIPLALFNIFYVGVVLLVVG